MVVKGHDKKVKRSIKYKNKRHEKIMPLVKPKELCIIRLEASLCQKVKGHF